MVVDLSGEIPDNISTPEVSQLPYKLFNGLLPHGQGSFLPISGSVFIIVEFVELSILGFLLNAFLPCTPAI